MSRFHIGMLPATGYTITALHVFRIVMQILQPKRCGIELGDETAFHHVFEWTKEKVNGTFHWGGTVNKRLKQASSNLSVEFIFTCISWRKVDLQLGWQQQPWNDWPQESFSSSLFSLWFAITISGLPFASTTHHTITCKFYAVDVLSDQGWKMHRYKTPVIHSPVEPITRLTWATASSVTLGQHIQSVLLW